MAGDMIVTNSRSDPLMLSRAFGRVFWSYLGYSPVVDCLPGTPTGYTPNVLNILPFESSLGIRRESNPSLPRGTMPHLCLAHFAYLMCATRETLAH